MGIIEQAAKRLEELSRAGVSVPWGADGADRRDERDAAPAVRSLQSGTSFAARRAEALHGVPGLGSEPVHVVHPARKELETVEFDIDRLVAEGHVVPTGARSRLAEEFRHIKRPLLHNVRTAAPQERKSLIMVTSALPGEGKTFCSINLAMSMALEVDTSVLLVDADVVRPDLLRRLGVPQKKGLLDVLTHRDVELSDVLLNTNVPKLTLLPAGECNTRSTELLSSHAMSRLLDELLATYPDHIVVLDGPPLLLTNEAKVLATRVGQVVVVVEASSTPRSAVEQAFGVLDKCETVLSVLNKGKEGHTRYGYGYGYGYGDYHG